LCEYQSRLGAFSPVIRIQIALADDKDTGIVGPVVMILAHDKDTSIVLACGVTVMYVHNQNGEYYHHVLVA